MCGAFAYHCAHGVDLEDLALKQDAMRNHLIKNFES